MEFYCDSQRHLVCVPYSVENLHKMAAQLGIKRCWYHAASGRSHYDIPKRRVEEVRAKCHAVSSRELLRTIKNG